MKINYLCIIIILGMTRMYCLEEAPKTLESYKEVATQYISGLSELYNDLTPAERIFVYYMYRASLPGNRFCSDNGYV